MAMIMRAELAQPGHPDRRPEHLQRPLLDPRRDHDLRLRDPGLRRDRELRPAADDRRAGHGVPAPERASASGCCRSPGLLFVGQLPRARAAPSTPAGPATRRSRPGRRSGQSFFNLGVQFAGASSIATALNFLVTIITMRAPGMNFWRMPLLVWANLSTSLLVVAATPFIAGVQFMVLFDRALHTNFFQAAFGGDVHQLPAHLLVLLAPGRLHHDAAGLRDRQRGDLDPRPQADLRLPADGAGADRDRGALLHGLGAPHVRLRDVQLAARADDDHDAADRGPDRDQDLLLARDAVRRRSST